MSDDTNKLADGIPKGVGLSRKAVFTVMGVVLTMLLLVMILIFHYRSQNHHSVKKTHTPDTSQVEASTTAIDNLRNKSNGSLIKAQGPTQIKHDALNHHMPEHQARGQATMNQVQDESLRDALKAPISAYSKRQSQSRYDKAYNAQVDAISKDSHALSEAAQDALANLQPGGNYNSQNMQKQKTAFLKKQSASKKFYLSSHLTKPLSPFEVKAGTIIPALLLTGINSDLPGQISAQVSRNVYDTLTGNYLLIPQGTRILGAYDSSVAYGQSRVLIAWQRLIFPNGDSFDLQGQPGADLAGMAGLHDLTDNHYVRIFGSALMFSVFGALGQLSQPNQNNNGNPTNQQIIYGAIGQQLTQTGAQMVQKNMNIQPTITIRPGAAFNVLLTRDMVLPHPYQGV